MSEESYLVSARKYRPQLFGEIVAQGHVSETLKNAVRLDRLAHAYLFTGPRGVGKTTAARVLAKAINCTASSDTRPDSAEPCRQCESCISFEQGRNLNIIEIDAASNNKVDDARDIRETVRIPPQGGRMKVYIIDEVHMLTTQAFNALLKTLEEPPPHALFIFATTEPHKVPATIQSRCQRFDFRRIATTEIAKHVRAICDSESITIDDASLLLIARKGDGALRDALSVLDQAISLCGETITHDELVHALGIVDTDLFFDVTEGVATSNIGAMFHVVEKIVGAGYDLQEFLDGLEEHLRHLLVMSTIGDDALLDVTPESASRLATESKKFAEATLLRMIHIVAETSDRLRMARQPRLRLEMALVKMASLPAAVDIRSALDKLDSLDKAVRNADLSGLHVKTTPLAQAEKPSSVPKADAQKAQPEPEPEPTPQPAPEPDLKVTEPEPTPQPAPEPELKITEHEPEIVPSPVGAESTPNPPAPPPVTSDTPRKVAPESERGRSLFEFGEPALKVKRVDDAGSSSANSESSLSTETSLETSSTQVGQALLDIDVLEPETNTQIQDSPVQTLFENRIKDDWSAVIDDTMESQIRLGSLLRQTKVVKVSGEHVEIAVPDDFHRRMLLNEKSGLGTRLSEKSGESVHDLHFSVQPEHFDKGDFGAQQEFDTKEFLKIKCEENPTIKKLMERFGGEIVW